MSNTPYKLTPYQHLVIRILRTIFALLAEVAFAQGVLAPTGKGRKRRLHDKVSGFLDEIYPTAKKGVIPADNREHLRVRK
jgi:hypothetical protein